MKHLVLACLLIVLSPLIASAGGSGGGGVMQPTSMKVDRNQGTFVYAKVIGPQSIQVWTSDRRSFRLEDVEEPMGIELIWAIEESLENSDWVEVADPAAGTIEI